MADKSKGQNEQTDDLAMNDEHGPMDRSPIIGIIGQPAIKDIAQNVNDMARTENQSEGQTDQTIGLAIHDGHDPIDSSQTIAIIGQEDRSIKEITKDTTNDMAITDEQAIETRVHNPSANGQMHVQRHFIEEIGRVNI